MRRRWVVGVGLVVGAAFVAVTAAPGLKLRQAKAAARAEGIAVESADIPQAKIAASENAAPAIERATEAWRKNPAASPSAAYRLAAHRLVNGYAQPPDKTAVRAWSQANEPLLSLWRTAAGKPHVDFGRKTIARWEALSRDVIDERDGAATLIAAPAADLDPQANLLAAARLSNLLRQESGLYAIGRGARLGFDCLRVARRKGVAKRVLAVLDPPSDLRRALLPELPRLLKRIEAARREPQMRQPGLLGWLGSARFALTYPEHDAIARWRRFWKALPASGMDYEAAARLVDRELPDVLILAYPMNRMTGPSSYLGGSPFWMTTSTPGVSGSLRQIGFFEELRRKPF